MNKKGVTLIEVVVSVIVLSLIALGVSATLSLTGKTGVSGSLQELQAMNYARQTLEQLRNKVTANSTVYDAAFSTVAPIAAPLNASSEFVTKYNGSRTYEVINVPNTNDTLKQVTVTVTWDE